MKLKKVLCAVIAGTMVMSNAVMVFANENSCDGGHTYTTYSKKCDVCGDVADHECSGIYRDSEINWNGNCLEDGIVDFTCTLCGKTASITVEGNEAHNYSDGICTRCGVEEEKHTHFGGTLDEIKWKDGDCTKGGTAYYLECEGCNEDYAEPVEARAAHTFTDYENKCDVCMNVTAHTHAGGKAGSIKYKDDDCTKGGTQAFTSCAKCGEDYSTEISAYSGHDYVNGKCKRCILAEPACKHKNLEYKATDRTHHKSVCKDCGETVKEKIDCDFCRYESDKDDDEQHYVECYYCSNYKKEDHELKYKFKSNGKHKAECEICGYTEKESCDYDSNGKCIKCCHYKDGIKANSEPGEVQSLRNSGQALAKNTVTVTVNNNKFDVVAKTSDARNTTNQYIIANYYLTQKGFNKLNPTKTFDFSVYDSQVKKDAQQTLTWSGMNLSKDEKAFVIFWNPTSRTQVIECNVDAAGNAVFTVPSLNGAIMTLVRASK